MTGAEQAPAPLALPEYAPGVALALGDGDRWPTMDAAGRARLERLRSHPQAPIWVHQTGDRLDAAGIVAAQTPLPTEGWLPAHLAVAAALPAYRRMSCTRLEDFPLLSRSDLVGSIASFVPDDADLSELVQGTSSGSTGAALVIPNHPVEVARQLHLLVELARRHGVDWNPDPHRMALANIVYQRQAFSYASILSSFGQAGMARVNLHPGQWRQPGDRDAFLREQNPQVLSGNPTSLQASLDIEGLHPLVVFSGAMHLSSALRARLEQRYAVPVIDLFSLRETGPLAYRVDDGDFTVLDRRLHIEIFDAAGRPLAPGERGEIVVTVGENPLLPLVRYRTGDVAALRSRHGRLALSALEGRSDAAFRSAAGELVASVDFTQQLQSNGALGWALTQHADGSLTGTIVQGDLPAIAAAAAILLGLPVDIRQVQTLAELGEGKPRRYTAPGQFSS